MLELQIKEALLKIWKSYLETGKKVIDTKGNDFGDIDAQRLVSIVDIKEIISAFQAGSLNLYEFKTSLDSYNKQNNYWGFTAAKGQMFFNLLTKSSETQIENLTSLLKELIQPPSQLSNAFEKIKSLFSFTTTLHEAATDKRRVPNPKSSAYFLSYFWQIHDPAKWPIMYSSILVSFEKLGIWTYQDTAQENYKAFYELNEEIRLFLVSETKTSITNWDLEHALWNFSGTTTVNSKQSKAKIGELVPLQASEALTKNHVINPGFDLNDYLIPRVARLVDIGASIEKRGPSKGVEFERLVAETFGFLDFEVENLGQGSGREPDAIIKYKEGHVAFIVDAKAYSSGYSLGTDDRAIREYISYHTPKLKQEGLNKIGFIIVSNSFKSNYSELISEITWTTEVRRFILMTTEALQYLLAYKIKDKLSVQQIIEAIVNFTSVVTKESIVEEFGDY